jgi:cupin domain
MKKHRKRIVVAAAGAALVALAVAGTVLATQQIGVTTTALTPTTGTSFGEIDVNTHTIPADIWQLREKTNGLSDGYVVDNKIAPGGTTGWHRHPGPSLIFVIDGTVTDYEGDDPTCTGHAYSAGQGFVDSGEGAHTLRNEGSVQAETVAVQLVPAGAPRKIDVTPGPGNCPF